MTASGCAWTAFGDGGGGRVTWRPKWRTMRIAEMLVAATALTVLVGCPPSDRHVIETLPPPVYQPVQPSPTPRQVPTPRPTITTLVGKRVMIDPGHGGKDPGAWKATRSRLPEKTIVLDIGNKVAANLEARGATVSATRTDDTYPTLDQRANAAERHKVDLFVSIHADSAPNKAASGAEVFVYTQASSKSRIAANCIIAAFKRAGIKYRGIKPGNFHVLREHSRPAILVECGFLTNAGDARMLNDPAHRTRIAEAITQGIADYLAR